MKRYAPFQLPAYRGPYKMLEQRKNDVICKDLINSAVNPFLVDNFKILHGSDDDAYKMAMLDADHQRQNLAYRGDRILNSARRWSLKFVC